MEFRLAKGFVFTQLVRNETDRKNHSCLICGRVSPFWSKGQAAEHVISEHEDAMRMLEESILSILKSLREGERIEKLRMNEMEVEIYG